MVHELHVETRSQHMLMPLQAQQQNLEGKAPVPTPRKIQVHASCHGSDIVQQAIAVVQELKLEQRTPTTPNSR